jgi:hypothetical protein
LHLEGCPGNIHIGNGAVIASLVLQRCTGSLTFPERLSLEEFVWIRSPLCALPDGLRVDNLNLTGSRNLVRLRSELSLGSLDLSGCTGLELLPDRLEAESVDLTGCTRLGWQEDALAEVARLCLADCRQITRLPDWLFVESVDVANTGLKALPEHLRGIRVLWRGVRIDERIAFRPDEIQVPEILAQRNAEVRRVMLERMGWVRFVREGNPEVLDRDTDLGGERRLLAVTLDRSEYLVFVSLKCPSTGRQYVLRVPPRTRTCRQAAAWIAGFEDPDDYEPVVET